MHNTTHNTPLGGKTEMSAEVITRVMDRQYEDALEDWRDPRLKELLTRKQTRRVRVEETFQPI